MRGLRLRRGGGGGARKDVYVCVSGWVDGCATKMGVEFGLQDGIYEEEGRGGGIYCSSFVTKQLKKKTRGHGKIMVQKGRHHTHTQAISYFHPVLVPCRHLLHYLRASSEAAEERIQMLVLRESKHTRRHRGRQPHHVRGSRGLGRWRRSLFGICRMKRKGRPIFTQSFLGVLTPTTSGAPPR